MNANAQQLFSYAGSKNSKNKSSTMPDPYVLYSTSQMPTNISDVLRLCEFIWLTSGQYKMAMQRVVRYFLTKVTFDGVSDKEKTRYEEFFNDELKIMTLLAELGDDFSAYGNSFSSVYMPFNRILYCSQCSFSRLIDNIPDSDIGLDTKKKSFTAMCPRCKKKTNHKHNDKRTTDESRIRLIRWNPHEIELMHNFVTGETAYIWKISSDIATNVKAGKPYWLRHTPWEVIEAVIDGANFQFNDSVVYHMKEPVIAGVNNRGWGIPRMLAAYKNIYYLQILHRYNEALALDWIVPFRLITPAKQTSADPLLQFDMNQWSSRFDEMLMQHRKDPSGWHTMPFPVQYQTLSGEGQQLSPWQLIKQGGADMMNALGVPVELFQGSLQVQAAPLAARMFESQWPHLVAELNGVVQWLADKASELFGWSPVTAKLQPPTLADDLERKTMLVQMASAGQISKETGYAPLNIDWFDEIRRQMEENRAQQELQQELEDQQAKKQELQETMTGPPQGPAGMGAPGMIPMGPGQQPMPAGGPAAGMPAATPAGGMPGMMTPGPNQAITPQELMQQAQALAEQFMSMPETIRRSQLINLKKNNPLLHAQVSQLMENMTQDAATQGVAMMRQQMKGAM